ncbi:MAG: flippase [Candidatus Zixiibacteriota bacterium]|nr:MAG: flippase [candidate division Zixibacteria bacterium]
MELNNGEDTGWLEAWRSRARDSLEKYRGAGLRVLFQNFMSLSVLQAANYLLPLIVLPYLVRVIGIEKFGLIVFAQAVIQYFNIVTDYGFHLSATREIAVNRNDPQKISTIFSAVMIIKSILAILCLGILVILIALFDKFGSEATVYLLTFGTVIGNLLFPTWFFQGMEKMKYITLLAVLGRVIYLLLLFIFVHQESDYVTVPLLNSIGMIITGLVSTFVVLSKFKVRLHMPAFGDVMQEFKDSSQYFLSRISVSIYSSFNTVILGFFTTNEAVGFYAAAEKLFIAMRSAFNPLVQALYPYMAARSNVSFFKKVFAMSVGASTVLAVAVFVFSDFIIQTIFGAGFELSSQLLRLFTVVVPFVMASILLGYPFLAALGREKYANFSIAIGSVVHLFLIALLIPIISPIAVAAAMIVTQLVVLAIRIHGVKKHQLWKIP